MKVTLILADSAQVAQDKLYILGGGWTWCGPQPVSFAAAGLIEVPWDQTNRQHHFLLRLVDPDGNLVLVPGPAGDQPLMIDGQLEVGRPPGTPQGASITVPVAFNFSNVPLPPGHRFVLELAINDETREEWQVGFNTRPAV